MSLRDKEGHFSTLGCRNIILLYMVHKPFIFRQFYQFDSFGISPLFLDILGYFCTSEITEIITTGLSTPYYQKLHFSIDFTFGVLIASFKIYVSKSRSSSHIVLQLYVAIYKRPSTLHNNFFYIIKPPLV